MSASHQTRAAVGATGTVMGERFVLLRRAVLLTHASSDPRALG
jgi:hypothetical protein